MTGGTDAALRARRIACFVVVALQACSGDRADFPEKGGGTATSATSSEGGVGGQGGASSSGSEGSTNSSSSSSSNATATFPSENIGGSANEPSASESTLPSPTELATTATAPESVPSASSTSPSPSSNPAETKVDLLLAGALCDASSSCAEGTCQAGELEDRCCSEQCAADEFCSETGVCFACAPGAREECWESSTGEALELEPTNEGNCQIGERRCTTEGQWSACEGAVGPAATDGCETAGADDDCNGTPNEDCECVDGTMRPCGSDVGNCEQGTQTCTGSTWGECVGEVAKEAQDSCAIEDDDANCDGEPNGNCGCIGTKTQDCNDCGTQTCNPDARDWGACSAPQRPAETRCVEGSQSLVETCSPQGNWVSGMCEFVCTNGSCGGSCEPGAARCQTGPERREACVNGNWDRVESCATGMKCVGAGEACKRSDGGSCSGNSDCVSGNCVDGICCKTSCAAVTCTSFDTECLTHPASVTQDLCGGDGNCRAAADVCEDVATPKSNTTSCTYPNMPGGRCHGAGACQPPVVTCGNQTCSLDAEVCCWKGQTGNAQDPNQAECSTSAACLNTGSDGLDKELTCDEHTDCASDKECCWVSGNTGRAIYCAPKDSCPQSNQGGSWRVLCKTPVATYSCPNNTTCTTKGGGFSICEPDE